MFSEQELAYLQAQPLARIATVDNDGQPTVVVVGFQFDGALLHQRSPALRQQASEIWPASGAGKRRHRRKALSMEQERAHHEHAEVAIRGHPEAATRKEGTAMPNAVVMTGYGPPEVLKWAWVPLREPGEGQIRIKVKAAGISPTDLALRAGYLKAIPLPPHAVLGFEAAGTVDAVGSGVTGTSIGDGVTALLADGLLRLRAHQSMPMQQAAEAHRQLESGTVHERIILTL